MITVEAGDLLVLSGTDVDRVAAALNPDDLVALMEMVFAPLDEPTDDPPSCPHRISLNAPEYTALVMPARLPPFGSAIKVVSVGSDSGLPASTILLSPTGVTKSILNARRLTALRNAGASLLSLRIVSDKGMLIQSIVVYGSGEQIRAHVALFLRAHPSITQVLVIARDLSSSRSTTLLSTLSSMSIGVEFTMKTEASKAELAYADVIICATPSTAPLFTLPPTSKKQHLILIGSYKPHMFEVHPSLLLEADLVLLDDLHACMREAGELLGAAQLGLKVPGSTVRVIGHKGQNEKKSDGKRPHGLTIFKSVGTGLQDVAIAAWIYDQAVAMGLGTTIKKWDS